jgi:hypothetical protein
MPSTVPTPVAAAIGIVPAVYDSWRRLPGRAVRLPIYALGTALNGVGTARREYDALAVRGEQLLARLRGTSFDELEDRVEDALQGTPLATPYDKVEDALEDAGEAVTSFARSVPTRARRGKGKAAELADDAADEAARAAERVAEAVADTATGAAPDAAARAADSAASAVTAFSRAAEPAAREESAPRDEEPGDEQPKGVATPKATQPDSTRIDTAATADVVETVEQVSDRIGGDVVAHDELPLPDYDHMTLGSLRGRMRSLDLPQLVTLRDYEKAHANRLPIVTMLDNRIAKLATDPTAPLSGGGTAPKKPAKRGKGKVSPDTAAPPSTVASPQVAFGGLGGASHPR